jgi:hypothetical protein
VVVGGSVEVHQVAMVQSSTVFSISMVKAESEGNSLWHRNAEMQAMATPKVTIENYPDCSIIPIVATLTLLLVQFSLLLLSPFRNHSGGSMKLNACILILPNMVYL